MNKKTPEGEAAERVNRLFRSGSFHNNHGQSYEGRLYCATFCTRYKDVCAPCTACSLVHPRPPPHPRVRPLWSPACAARPGVSFKMSANLVSSQLCRFPRHRFLTDKCLGQTDYNRGTVGPATTDQGQGLKRIYNLPEVSLVPSITFGPAGNRTNSHVSSIVSELP